MRRWTDRIYPLAPPTDLLALGREFHILEEELEFAPTHYRGEATSVTPSVEFHFLRGLM